MNVKYTIFNAMHFKKEYLKAKLDMLGFKNLESLDQPLDYEKQGYHVLGRIGSDLEKYINPARYVLKQKENDDELFEEYIRNIEVDKSFMENQDELFARIRAIYPDFALHMADKVSAEDWQFYTQTMQKTGKLIRDLTVGSTERDLKMIPEEDEQEIISEFIDSRDFAKACNIEDTFMTQEFEEFKKVAQEWGYEDENVKNTAPCVAIAELVRKSETLGNKKKRYISNYEKYEKFLEGLTDKVTIQSKIPHEKEGVDRYDD